ncbi:amino acid permease-domain-containing protein [Dactylonectria macrodidyma]|uniref:Amino acid permease-domain-containing protein n=1 Tax=Dactylonectria macrodidyma TaxID=307937 RepID=A0A9P9J2M9_9HYPO|nr:amino acid permease-domain-containing protein [Dactylonectria macrodidyma]
MPNHASTYHDAERRPLLASEPSGSSSRSDSRSAPAIDHERNGHSDETKPSRAIEDDVLPETSILGRNLSWNSAYIIVISRVIGSGIFATPGSIVKSVGSPGLSLILWLVGAVVAACGLSISLEYGCMLPRSGGSKVYLEFTYRHPRFLASTLIAMHAVCLNFTASNCIIFSQYVLFSFGVDEPSEALRKGLAVGLLTAISVTHAVFPKAGIRLQNTLGWMKIGIVIFMIFSGLYVVIFRPSVASPTASPTTGLLSWDNLWENSTWNWGVISTALFKVFYSYAGLDNVGNILNEVKDPVRTLRSVALTALATSCGMYMLINVAYFLVVPIEEIKDSGELIAALFFERVFGERVGRNILPLVVAISAIGNVLVVTFAVARLKQEIARQGFLPFSDILSSTKPFGSPLGGLLVNYVPSFLVITLPPSSEVYSFILEIEGYQGQMFSFALGVGLLWLRYKRPDLKRPFKTFIPAVLLSLSLSVSLLAAPLFPPEEKWKGGLFYATYAIVGASFILGGVLYWYIWTVLLPKWRGYTLEEETQVLDDGTSITKLTYARPSVAHDVTIHDVRGEEDKYTLDGNGFQVFKRGATEKDFLDDEQIKASYYPEVEQLLKDVTGASRVFIFDHTIRRQPPGDDSADRSRRGPVQRVHIDQSYDASLSRVPHHLPEDADELLKGRVQIINVWRPIKTVQRDPLALADAFSVSDSDLVVTELIYPTRRGETYAVRYNEGQKWFYKSYLSPEEVLLIKCFDSKKDGRARRVPHTAFVDPSSADDAPSRESIEIRALVFHPDDRE